MWRGLAVAAALLLAGPAAAENGIYDFRTEKVTDRVHRVFRPDDMRIQPEGNVTVVEQADGLVVIDAGGAPAAGEKVVAQIRAISPKPVKALVLTHYHGDHTLGAAAFLKAWPGVALVSTTRTRENMLGPPMAYIKTYGKDFGGYVETLRKLAARADLPEEMRRGWARAAEDAGALSEAYRDVVAHPAPVTFTGRLVLHDADAPVEVVAMGRGHTDGDAVAWLPRQRVLATGDLVIAPLPFAFNVFPGEWIGVLETLRGYDFAYLVPGHGLVQTDRGYLDRLIALVRELRDQVGPLAREGVSKEEVRKRVTLDRQAELFAQGSAWNRRFFKEWFVFPGIQAAWQEARGEPIVPGAKIE